MGVAFRLVDLAQCSSVPSLAAADEPLEAVEAFSAVLARGALALVDLGAVPLISLLLPLGVLVPSDAKADVHSGAHHLARSTKHRG